MLFQDLSEERDKNKELIYKYKQPCKEIKSWSQCPELEIKIKQLESENSLLKDKIEKLEMDQVVINDKELDDLISDDEK